MHGLFCVIVADPENSPDVRQDRVRRDASGECRLQVDHLAAVPRLHFHCLSYISRRVHRAFPILSSLPALRPRSKTQVLQKYIF